ncbi:MAG: two-component system, OmpR family, sensor histidine kinase VicK [Patescibacteria group bacterium]|nr:two-component system, OmpR family, sensor histidine kinase VicK [Patescibacteria group bacterium]
MPVSIAIYLLTATIPAIIILNANGALSIFVALWVLVCLFAGIFGLWGTLTLFLYICIFIANQYIKGVLTTDTMISIVLSSVIPLIASSIIWRSKSSRDELEDGNKAYRNLANELNEVTSKSEIVINAIGDGVIAIDSQGIIRLINPAAQQIIGWGKQDALSLNYKSVLKLIDKKNEALDVASDPIQQVLNNNQQIRTNDQTIITSSDKKIMISLVVSPAGETGSGVIAVFHDITKEKTEEREQAEFISTASHEMRTPVASIEGYLGLALNAQTAQIDDRARDFILKAHASAEHLGRLFQDLLDISKADDGHLSNNPQMINIVTFTHDIVQGLEEKATNKGLRLIFKPMPDNTAGRFVAPAYSVNLDNDHIREIINNLVENAIKYTPKGEVIVDITGDDDRVVVSVKDNGIGIPAEDIPHLFQKFYRVDNENTRQIGGTGLGLYLSRRLAEIMGGRIWVESVYKSGSTFYLELPRLSPQDANMIASQKELVAQEKANQEQKVSTEPVKSILNKPPIVEEPANNVPRGQALTPEQIAVYVKKQRELAQQQNATSANNTNNRPPSVSVPTRNPQK